MHHIRSQWNNQSLCDTLLLEASYRDFVYHAEGILVEEVQGSERPFGSIRCKRALHERERCLTNPKRLVTELNTSLDDNDQYLYDRSNQ